MTVCIAAISDDGQKAILVADKMLTSVGGLLPYQNDGSGDKIVKIRENVHVLWAGGLTDANNILAKFKNDHPDTTGLTVQQIAYALREAHLAYLLEVLERENVIGRGIQNLAAFYGGQTNNLTLAARQTIENALATFNLNTNTQFIVCGKDEDNLYKIFVLQANPRNVVTHVDEGSTQIGSGFGHAQFAIVHSKYKPALPQADVLKILKDAKKKAEKSPDVGKETDIVQLS